ncbi:agenet domain-containing protein [Tanacetum coccineum]
MDNSHLNFITKGSQVEITSDTTNLHTGAWFSATVIHPPPSHAPNNHLVYVEYHTLLTDNGTSRLREYANVDSIRPSPPPLPLVDGDGFVKFEVDDLVDVFYRDGWWTGVVTRVVDEINFVVRLRVNDGFEEVEVNLKDLRVHRKWVGSKWVLPNKQSTAGLMFTVGKKVEVSFDKENLRDVWFPATVLQNSGDNTFLVEYQQPGSGDEAVLHKVTVDHSHIRPSPPHLRDKNFVLLEKVDAYYDYGWWSGVITKELADNRYNVFFKHTKKEREFICSEVRPHIEWKGGKWFNTSQGLSLGEPSEDEDDAVMVKPIKAMEIDKQIEQSTPSIGKQSTVATSTMERTKQTNLDNDGNNSAPSKKSKDETLLEDSSKIINDTSAGQSEGLDSEFGKTENLSHGKKVEGKEEDAASVTPRRKRGRPRKLQPIIPETPVTVNHQNGGVGPAEISVVEGVQVTEVSSPTSPRTKSLEKNQEPVEEPNENPVKEPNEISVTEPNENPEQDASAQRGKKKHSSAKGGRRGKRRTISVNESLAQDTQDASKEKANGSLEAKSPETSVVQSVDTMDDQPLSTWIEGVHSPVTLNGPVGTSTTSERQLEIVACDIDANISFVKTSPLWDMIESMEAFQKLPQNPHFRPLLKGVKVSAREGLAIGNMVTFSNVVDRTFCLRFDDPRTAIEDSLETLVDLESNGFDVEVIRDRLTHLLLLKDKQEELEDRSKGVAEEIEEQKIQEKTVNDELDEFNKQIRQLEEKRRKVLLKKEKWTLEIGAMKATEEAIEQELLEVAAEFDGLAAAPF